MVSAKKVVIVFLLLFAVALIGAGLELMGIEYGRYLAYISVPIGAILAIGAAILAMLNKLNNDLK